MKFATTKHIHQNFLHLYNVLMLRCSQTPLITKWVLIITIPDILFGFLCVFKFRKLHEIINTLCICFLIVSNINMILQLISKLCKCSINLNRFFLLILDIYIRTFLRSVTRKCNILNLFQIFENHCGNILQWHIYPLTCLTKQFLAKHRVYVTNYLMKLYLINIWLWIFPKDYYLDMKLPLSLFYLIIKKLSLILLTLLQQL